MSRIPPAVLGGLTCAVAVSSAAKAQIHADIDLEAGASLHVLSSRPSSLVASNPDPGPSLGLSAHLAILPLVRAGFYVLHDFSPLPRADLREFTSAGLSVRLFSPWPRGDFRVWLALGLGYAASEAPGNTSAAASTGMMPAEVPGTKGGFIELPLGMGSSFQVSRNFELVGEAGARVGLAFTGSMYGSETAGAVPPSALPVGNDVVTVFVVLGAALQL